MKTPWTNLGKKEEKTFMFKGSGFDLVYNVAKASFEAWASWLEQVKNSLDGEIRNFMNLEWFESHK